MIDEPLLARAGALLRGGGLVAFPTETVYGLGANALDPVAVERIFLVKGRPASSPLIVHVDSIEMAQSLAAEWPAAAEDLAQAFWPGPLTLVVHKHPRIPDIVTAGLDTVGLRQPDHPTALALIRAAGVPVAAPSANKFGELSPTTAEHVIESFGQAIDLILDGGPTQVGIESTVLSLAETAPVLLRPGAVTADQIEDVIGLVARGNSPASGGAHRSPGLHKRHYSPRTPLYLVEGGEIPVTGRGAYLWLTSPLEAAEQIQMPPDAAVYAATLYETLHRLDAQGLDWIAVEAPPSWPEWAAINDRLRRASS